MLQFNSYNSIQQTPKAKINFGEGRYESYGSYNSEGKTAEEIKAERIARLIEDASKSEKMPSAARSFFVIGALMSAGALTGAALSRRVFNILNEMGLLKKITPAVSNVLEKAKVRLDSINKDSLGKIKQAILKATKGTVNYLDDELRLKEIAKKDLHSWIRVSAIKRIEDKAFVLEIIESDDNRFVRESAKVRLKKLLG